MLDALTRAEELITHTIGDTPEARETLRAIRTARTAYLRLMVRAAESGRLNMADAIAIVDRAN
jgi:hypothetical protein